MIIIEEIWGFWNLDQLSALVHQPACQFTSLNDHNITSRLRIRVYKIFSMCYEILLLLREHFSRQARLSRGVQFVLNNFWLELVFSSCIAWRKLELEHELSYYHIYLCWSQRSLYDWTVNIKIYKNTLSPLCKQFVSSLIYI